MMIARQAAGKKGRQGRRGRDWFAGEALLSTFIQRNLEYSFPPQAAGHGGTNRKMRREATNDTYVRDLVMRDK